MAVARASLREPDLPAAHLDDESRQVRLLVDHCEDLIGERTRQINRLRWHLHELDPAWDPPQRLLNRYKQLDEIIAGSPASTVWSPGWRSSSRRRCEA